MSLSFAVAEECAIFVAVHFLSDEQQKFKVKLEMHWILDHYLAEAVKILYEDRRSL